MYIADLHIHSRYSRATSKECTPEHLDLWARKKGIHLLGTGDFTHPAWRQELEEKLTAAEEGLYRLRDEFRLKDGSATERFAPRFVISGEISSIYKKNGKVRKVHNLILLPGLKEAWLLSRKLEAIGNIHSDGRPILGLDSRDLLEITLDVCPRAIFVPAHIWTPHFSMFGAFSGFDSVEECFEDLSSHIRAFETGLSSDPAMNWRLSALDRFQMISNSDAHSPSKLGREANLLDIQMCYDGLYNAVQEGKGLAGTIEFFPEEGKYHYDGHRKCHLCLSPREAEAYHGRCPVCGKKLTLGVSHRIEQLADRDEGFARPGAAPFESLVPLLEVIAASTGCSAASVKVRRQYEEMLGKLGTEFEILREISTGDIEKRAGYFIAEGIRRLRQGNVQRFPGFDGEYGTIQLFAPSELNSMDGQISMFGLADLGLKKAPETAVGAGTPPAADKREQNAREAVGEERPEEMEAPGRERREELNEDQLLAVRTAASRIAVIAGPGTGKTRTLVSRILYLLQSRRVKPSEITAVTFTNRAAQEMRDRLEEELGGKRGIRNLRIGTFHSLCHSLLRETGEDFTLADEDTVLEVVRECAESLGVKEKPKKLRQAISRWKTSGAREREGMSAADMDFSLDDLVRNYEARLGDLSALDFDDLLLKALEKAGEGGKPFPYLLVDEFQDVSPLQYDLIREWSRGGREVFIIGDPDQAIYGFRGADSQSFDRFCREEETQVIRLGKNYRSAPEILAASREVLKSGGEPLEPMQNPGFPVRLAEIRGEKAEAIFAAREINRLVGGIDMLDAHEEDSRPDDCRPRSFGDVAILYRTHRQSELLEECLKTEGIPYIVAGREEFLELPCVRAALAFFRSICRPGDRMSRKVCLRLLWNVEEDQTSQCGYEALAEKYKKMCRRGKPQNLWRAWREDMGLMEEEAMEKLENMSVFYKNMDEMLTALSFGRESDLRRCGGKNYVSDAVTLMTMHGSKGLEFPAVLLHGVKKGRIPLEYRGGEADVEEERRLLYVAMTRAKEELILTSSGEVSEFVRQIPEELIVREQVKQRFGGRDGGRQMSLFDFL